jgi:hypothetical protein
MGGKIPRVGYTVTAKLSKQVVNKLTIVKMKALTSR